VLSTVNYEVVAFVEDDKLLELENLIKIHGKTF